LRAPRRGIPQLGFRDRHQRSDKSLHRESHRVDARRRSRRRAPREERRRAVEAYDDAVQWFLTQRDLADVSNRRSSPVRESTAAVYDRFFTVSRALSFCLELAFHRGPVFVDRIPQPLVPVEPLPVDELLDTMLARIPETERGPKNEALEIISGVVEDGVNLGNHDRVPPKELYFQILQHYEHVCIPMVGGTPDARLHITRNPARGFMDLRKELVVALCDAVGLRWGACDFGAESGDLMHFHLGHHGRD
jgi:hypothetical protein